MPSATEVGRPVGRPLDRPGIYSIRHKRSGKLYIGSSQNIRLRWWQHRSKLGKQAHHCIRLQNAWWRYGEDAFRFSVIEFCEVSELHVREQYYLDLHKPFYNMIAFAGQGVRGLRWTEDQKANYRVVRAEAGPTEAQRAAARETVKLAQAASPFGPGYYPSHRVGMKDTPEVIEKRRQSRLATIRDPAYANPAKGRKRPKKLMKAIHKKNRGQKRSPESRQKMRDAQLAHNETRRAAGVPHWNVKG